MTVSAVDQGSGSLYGGSGNANVVETQDQFLKLLITQIQYQDPMSPMDNNQFINQLTQFSSLEQLQSLNDAMDENMVYSQSLNNTAMLGLVGRTATVEGDGVAVVDGQASASKVMTSSGGTASVEVRDESGALVATYTVPVTAGWSDVGWDGLDAAGEAAADGEYTLTVSVADNAGADLEHTLYMSRIVESIRFENNIALLSIGGNDYYAAEIAEVGI